MATFDMRGQKVNTQTIVTGDVAGNVNVAAGNNAHVVTNELKQLTEAIDAARASQAITAEQHAEIAQSLSLAATEVQKSPPQGAAVRSHLERALSILTKGTKVVTGLVTAVVKVIDLVHRLIP